MNSSRISIQHGGAAAKVAALRERVKLARASDQIAEAAHAVDVAHDFDAVIEIAI
jgi:hypothetical protein